MPHEGKPVDILDRQSILFQKIVQRLGAEAAALTCSLGAGTSAALSSSKGLVKTASGKLKSVGSKPRAFAVSECPTC